MLLLISPLRLGDLGALTATSAAAASVVDMAVVAMTSSSICNRCRPLCVVNIKQLNIAMSQLVLCSGV
jgi:hypothetical protein